MSEKTPIGDGKTTCLVCGTQIKRGDGSGRGLCQNHYKQVQKQEKTLTADSWIKFEQKAIQLGILLPIGARGRPETVENPFRELANDMGLEYTVEETAKQHAKQAKQILDKNIKPKPNTSKRTQSGG